MIAQHGDVWFAEYKPGYRNFESNIERMAADVRAMDELAATYGRKLRYAINPQVICCETQAEAERLADEAERNAGPRDRMVNALGAITTSSYGDTPAFREPVTVMNGSRDLLITPRLAERLRRYEEVGIDIMMTRFTPMMEGMETFGTKVMPLLAREATE